MNKVNEKDIAIYKLDFDCGRQGSLNGTFTAEKEYVNALLKSELEVYFGEALGKHSEIYGTIDDGEITMVSDDKATVKVFLDNDLSSGTDPFCESTINLDSSELGLTEEEYETLQDESVYDIIKYYISK